MAATETGRMKASPSGDHDAFEQLITQHQRMIHSLCYRMTGSMSDAEDLAQETFVRAYSALPTFRSEARVSSWLYRIAVNQCLNWKSRKERQERVLRQWVEQADSTGPGDSGRTQQVQEALMRLSAKQRASIVLVTYDGLSHAEAAKVLGCSETTVSWRLFAARRKLKKLLKGVRT